MSRGAGRVPGEKWSVRAVLCATQNVIAGGTEAQKEKKFEHVQQTHAATKRRFEI